MTRSRAADLAVGQAIVFGGLPSLSTLPVRATPAPELSSYFEAGKVSAMLKTTWLIIASCGLMAAADLKVPLFFARQDFPSVGYAVAVGDVNGDGIPDILAFDGGLSVMLGKGGGLFQPAKETSWAWGYRWDGLAVADLNGDGKADVVISGGQFFPSNGIGVCFSNGDGTFQSPVFYPAGTDSIVGNPVLWRISMATAYST